MSQQSYKVKSAVLRGVEALPVEVEVLISSGIPSFSIVGMPDTASRNHESACGQLSNRQDFMCQAIRSS